MSTFWKPRLNIGPRTPDSAVTKQLGSMVYVLWCRCDLCFISGPSTLYHMWERAQESGQLCDKCDHQARLDGDLFAEGWQRIG